MKATIQLVIFSLVFLLVACGTEGKKVEAKKPVTPAKETPKASANSGLNTTYNLTKGTLNWTGSKLAGTSSHTGTIDIVLGDIKAKGEKMIGGQFVVNMGSIQNTDLPYEKQLDLVGHLKSPDFFDVAQFPTATFILTGAAPVTNQEDITHNITGNLTMKGISKSITIPANIAIVGDKLTAVTPAFKIDRTQWGVEYGNSSIVGITKDKIINNDISLVLSLEATSAAPLQ